MKKIIIVVFFSIVSLLSDAKNLKPVPAGKRQSVAAWFTEKDFKQFFPQHNPFYTYKSFIKAIDDLGLIKIRVERRGGYLYKLTRTDKKTGRSVVVRKDEGWDEEPGKSGDTFSISYADFCSEKDAVTNKRELAAFFAQIAHETRNGEDGKYNDGLMYIHEIDTTLLYIADNDVYPPARHKKYYGRGPIQLSYNGNYGYASDCIFGDKKILLNNPDLITRDAVTAFETAVYFWMTPQLPKPSAHDVMAGNWKVSAADRAKGRVAGFGMTINIVNGEVECNKGEHNSYMNDRIAFYRYFLKQLNVRDDGGGCSCGKMKPYL
jgi:hypothetical protein